MGEKMSATDAMEQAEAEDMGDGATMAYAAELCGADDDAVLVDMLEAEGYFDKKKKENK